ncbi:hypothetical protein BGZ70_009253, partial [Mortierella alpina]
MFDSHGWSRNGLPLPEIVEVAGLFLNFAQTTSNTNALLLLCGNVGSVLSAMKHGARKTLNPSLSAADQELCESVAAIFTEHGKLCERLESAEKAKISFKKAEKWSTSALTPGQTHPRGSNKVERTISRIAPEIFARDVILRPFKPKPPAADARISSTPQLVYCLTLLSSIPSGPHAIAVIDETLDDADRSWLQSMREDADEETRLRSLTGKLIIEFIDDDLKGTEAVAEVALHYIPDDESSLQSIMRRARIVASGISGVVSAVKGLDLNKFVEGLEEIQDGLAGAYQVVKIGVKGVAKVVELVENGAGLLDSLKEGFIFGQKCAWYPALRGSDTFIRNGQLAQFKRLVCEAPCRRDAAFQLG